MIRIALIGCTGSIGRQTADIVRRYPEKFSFSALACGRDGAALEALCAEFMPAAALCGEGVNEPSPQQPCAGRVRSRRPRG